MQLERPVLVVEDSHDDYEMILRSFAKVAPRAEVYRLVVGSDTLDYLNRRMGHQKRANEPLPRLILLDLHLPAVGGQELLREIKGSPQFHNIPVIVMSTSTSPEDIRGCYAAGANSYLTKPVDIDDYRHKLETLIDYWINTVEFSE